MFKVTKKDEGGLTPEEMIEGLLERIKEEDSYTRVLVISSQPDKFMVEELIPVKDTCYRFTHTVESDDKLELNAIGTAVIQWLSIDSYGNKLRLGNPYITNDKGDTPVKMITNKEK